MNEYEYRAQEEPAVRRLDVIDSIELSDLRCRRTSWVVDGFLKTGLAVLAGSPKIGKSWLVLQLCMQIAKGEPFWGMQTHRGTVLYIALEDSEQRMQERVLRITDEGSEKLKISFRCSELGSGVSEELYNFVETYPDTRLIVIDTFQKIRLPAVQMSYAVDYAEISHLKHIADDLNICVLLVHHTRKLGDSDCMNEISGTNGIAGSADTLLVMKKEKRTDRKATLFCTGRDIQDAEMNLEMDKSSCLWHITSDISADREKHELPELMLRLKEYMRTIGKYDGNNADFCTAFSKWLGRPVIPSPFKNMMSRYRFELEDNGVQFLSRRTAKERLMVILYNPQKDMYKDRNVPGGSAK